MQILIDISKDRYDEIMSMDWNKLQTVFDEEIRAIHDGKALGQEPCSDCIRRESIIEIVNHQRFGMSKLAFSIIAAKVKELPSVTPQPKMGRWIYDKNIDNWRCSECGETPKTMGYCGAADFMAKHFKYCNHCGRKMQEVEE